MTPFQFILFYGRREAFPKLEIRPFRPDFHVRDAFRPHFRHECGVFVEAGLPWTGITRQQSINRVS
jgi:hypothetical protein